MKSDNITNLYKAIKSYGDGKYAAGRLAAYSDIFKKSLKMLDKIEDSEDDPIRIVEDFVDTLEQVKALLE